MQTKIILAMCVSLLVAVGCSHKKHKAEEKAVETAANVNHTEYTTITFEKGQKELSEMNKHHLRQLAERAKSDGREVNEIKVLAWGDKEYSSDKSATGAEIKLADKRADMVKGFIKKDLEPKADIDEVNMAKKPSKWDELVENDTYKTKEAFQTEQMTSKASKAMVIYEFENQ